MPAEPPTPPHVNVIFYENFREVERDVHFVGGSLIGGTEMRTYHIHETISEEGGPVLEEKDYTEERNAIVIRVIVHCEASSGTFLIEFFNWLEGEVIVGEPRIQKSGPIPFAFNAEDVRAAVPKEPFFDEEGHFVAGYFVDDPGYLSLDRVTFAGGGSIDFPRDFLLASYHDRPDLGENTVEIRCFFDDGTTAGYERHGVREHDIDLGPIWETFKEWDEIFYNVLLEKNPACSGKGEPIDVPKGKIEPAAPSSTRVVSRSKVTGQVGSIRPAVPPPPVPPEET